MKLHLPVRLFRAVVALFSLAAGLATTLPQLHAAASDDAAQVTSVTEADLLSGDDIINATGEETPLEVLPSLLSGGYANGTISYSGYTSSSDGGAISDTDVTLSDYDTVRFNGNTAACGGAIYGSADSAIELFRNDTVTFSGNTASGAVDAFGGAIHGDNNSTITLSNNESVSFNANSASGSSYSFGGAIHGNNNCTITLSNNESVSFNANSASGSSDSCGGAIFVWNGSTITLSNNESVSFNANSASGSSYSSGSAIGVGDYSTITLSDNGTVSFSGNSAIHGGSICGSIDSIITLSDNGTVIFIGNSASGASNYIDGGAIQASGSLHIRNNDSVEFVGNVDIFGSTYCLRSICVVGSSEDTVSLSAAAEKNITFRDSMYIYHCSTVDFNADYTDAEGNTLAQKGDILFTGATTEADLLAAKGSAGTAEEILNSRTTEVYAMTNVYGGRLRVEDGAVYKGYGITMHEGSEATLRVKDATLNHAGYDITLNAGTTLELEGCNTITAANLVMLEGSNLHFVAGEVNTENAALTLTGTLSLGGDVTLSLEDDWDYGVHKLMSWSSLSGKISQLNTTMPGHYELLQIGNSLNLLVWQEVGLNNDATEWKLRNSAVRAEVSEVLVYNTASLNGGYYQVSGSGSMGVSGLLSVTGGAEVILDVDTTASSVVVGDDSSLSIRKGLNLLSLMTLAEEEGSTEAGKAISVGRHAELSLADATLLGQVSLADDSSEVYYQTQAGDKLLQFSGELGSSGLNLTVGEDGKTVNATDSAGFTGNITVLSGTTLVNASSATTDGLPFGDNYAAAPEKVLTVQGDATLDINGRETYYHVMLEEGATLANSGADVHVDWKGIPVLSLKGNAAVAATGQMSMVGANYADTAMELNGHTLSKTGAGHLVLRNTNIGAGTLAVNEGVVRMMNRTSTADDTCLTVNSGGTLWISEGTGSYAGKLKVNGGSVYLLEMPSSLGGDNGTDNQALDLSGLSSLELAGGLLSFRGSHVTLGTVDVTADSTLQLWDQVGSGGVSATASTIETLNANAALNLTTTWKSALDINVLTGGGSLSVGSSREQHTVNIQDISNYSGSFAVSGSTSTLSLNLGDSDVLAASRVSNVSNGHLVLKGSGTYDLGSTKILASGVTLGTDWTGSVRLTGATLAGDTLAGLSTEQSTVELCGVSGYLSRADSETGAQTYAANLKLTNNGSSAAWELNNGYNGDVRIFSGDISGTGTLQRSSYKGTNQTLIFTGDTSGWTGTLQHSPDLASNSGNLVTTDVTFSGTAELNVALLKNDKGKFNVTLDDEHLAPGSTVTVNKDIQSTTLTVTEGTTAILKATASQVTTTLGATEGGTATLSGVKASVSALEGLGEGAAAKDVQVEAVVGTYDISGVAMENVHFSAVSTTLTLANVSFDTASTFSVGALGSIILSNATLCLTLPEAGREDGIYRVDLSDLFQCWVVKGDLSFDVDTEALVAAGYTGVELDFGRDANEYYSNLTLSMEGATYAGMVGKVAGFTLPTIPEPSTATLSLLALAALASRRRRA